MHRTSPQVTGYGAMACLAGVMIIAVLCLAPRSAQAVSCVFADKGYSAGARACFCPRLEKKVGSYKIVQERWSCGDDGKWQPTEEVCANVATGDLRKALKILAAVGRDAC